MYFTTQYYYTTIASNPPMKKILSSLLTASMLTMGFVPMTIVDKYTRRNMDGTFRNLFRVQGIEYPYKTVHCVTASRETNRSERNCRGYDAQNSFAHTFNRSTTHPLKG